MPVLDLFHARFQICRDVRGISNPGQFPQGIRITLDSSNGNQMRSVSFPYQFLDHWPYFFRIDHRFHRFTQQMNIETQFIHLGKLLFMRQNPHLFPLKNVPLRVPRASHPLPSVVGSHSAFGRSPHRSGRLETVLPKNGERDDGCSK